MRRQLQHEHNAARPVQLHWDGGEHTHTHTFLHSFARTLRCCQDRLRLSTVSHATPSTRLYQNKLSLCMRMSVWACVDTLSDRSLTAVRLATGRFPPTSRRITTETQSTRRPWACGQDAISTVAPSTLGMYRYLRGCGTSTQEKPVFSRFARAVFQRRTINDDFN